MELYGWYRSQLGEICYSRRFRKEYSGLNLGSQHLGSVRLIEYPSYVLRSRSGFSNMKVDSPPGNLLPEFSMEGL